MTNIQKALELIGTFASGDTEKAASLLDEGYIKTVEIEEEGPQGKIKIGLKYGPNNESVVTGLRRISKPGLRVYARKEEVPKVLGGLGIAIISTSKGVMTDKKARQNNIGGEVLAYIW